MAILASTHFLSFRLPPVLLLPKWDIYHSIQVLIVPPLTDNIRDLMNRRGRQSNRNRYPGNKIGKQFKMRNLELSPQFIAKRVHC